MLGRESSRRIELGLLSHHWIFQHQQHQQHQHQRMLQIYALSLSLQVASMKFVEEDFIILSNPLGDLVPQQSVKLLVTI
jgi:hypothetical protein